MIRLSRARRTVRSAAAEFGPPPAALYPELAGYSDRELLSRPTADIIAEILAVRAAHLADRPMEVAR